MFQYNKLQHTNKELHLHRCTKQIKHIKIEKNMA